MLDAKLGYSIIYRIHSTKSGDYVVATSRRLVFYTEAFVKILEVVVDINLQEVIEYIIEFKRDAFYVFTFHGVYSVKRERK